MMKTVFHLQPHELNQDFLNTLQTLVNGHAVTIAVEEIESKEMDETEYLLSNPANRMHLLRAVANDNANNMIEMKEDEFERIKASFSKSI